MKEPMTYILTDRIHEFCQICDQLSLRRCGSRIFGGQNAVWVSRWDQMLGRRIYPHDQLVWGSYADSTQEHRIRCELAIRSKLDEF
jgi:hypothetical protein